MVMIPNSEATKATRTPEVAEDEVHPPDLPVLGVVEAVAVVGLVGLVVLHEDVVGEVEDLALDEVALHHDRPARLEQAGRAGGGADRHGRRR